MVGTLILEPVDTFQQVGLPLVVIGGRERSKHHDTNRGFGQHRVVRDVVTSRCVVGGRHIGLRQVDGFSSRVQVRQCGNSSLTPVHSGKLCTLRRGVGAVGAVRRDNLQLVVDTIGGVQSCTIVLPVRALIGKVFAKEGADIGTRKEDDLSDTRRIRGIARVLTLLGSLASWYRWEQESR